MTGTAESRRNKTTFELSTFAPSAEYSPEYFQGMLNRGSVSYFKYGSILENFPAKVDALACVQTCIAKYLATGNTEYLMDAGNYLQFEFIRPSHNDAFFAATDSAGSAGVVLKDGTHTHAYNQET